MATEDETTTARGSAGTGRRLRVYEGVRSAHLERFHALEPASVLFASRNYDFAEELLGGLDVAQHAGSRDLFLRVLRGRYDEVEINEPLMLAALKHSLVAVAALRLGGLLRRRRTTVVTYAIENLDPFTATNARLRTPWRRRAFALALRLLVGQVDRIAYGTPGARTTYAGAMRRSRAESVLVPALPTRCEQCTDALDSQGQDVVFLGAFDVRKGLRQLVEAWPTVAASVPGARLRILGKGELQSLAEGLAERDEVTLTVDPPREEIHRVLAGSAVLVLLSQPAATWREQVGLPLVEGLAHGCRVVATTETGIADWLAEHGHEVVDPAAGADEVAAAVVRALGAGRSAEQVLADLPEVDGRLGADRWMFSARS